MFLALSHIKLFVNSVGAHTYLSSITVFDRSHISICKHQNDMYKEVQSREKITDTTYKEKCGPFLFL